MIYSRVLLCLVFSCAALPVQESREIPTELYPPMTIGQTMIELDGPFKTCGSASDILTVEKVVLSPNPPRVGQPLTVSASGLTTESIEQGALVSVSAKVGPIVVVSKTLDVCSFVGDETVLKCPIAAGAYTLNTTVEIPNNAPRLNYYIKAVAKNANGKQITCIEGSIKLTFMDQEEDVFMGNKGFPVSPVKEETAQFHQGQQVPSQGVPSQGVPAQQQQVPVQQQTQQQQSTQKGNPFAQQEQDEQDQFYQGRPSIQDFLNEKPSQKPSEQQQQQQDSYQQTPTQQNLQSSKKTLKTSKQMTNAELDAKLEEFERTLLPGFPTEQTQQSQQQQVPAQQSVPAQKNQEIGDKQFQQDAQTNKPAQQSQQDKQRQQVYRDVTFRDNVFQPLF